MKKMPCLFVREFYGPGHFDRSKNKFKLTDVVTPGCEWVLAGEGVATRTWDGTAVLVKDGHLYARYDAKKGKTPPAGAIPCTEAPDPVTEHWPHWVLADRPQDHWIRQAAENSGLLMQLDGTYEAIGPNINGNADGWPRHVLMRHGAQVLEMTSNWRTFDGIRTVLADLPWEGLVFHHPDGRMCKIRRDDFGLPWPVPLAAEADDSLRELVGGVPTDAISTTNPLEKVMSSTPAWPDGPTHSEPISFGEET